MPTASSLADCPGLDRRCRRRRRDRLAVAGPQRRARRNRRRHRGAVGHALARVLADWCSKRCAAAASSPKRPKTPPSAASRSELHAASATASAGCWPASTARLPHHARRVGRRTGRRHAIPRRRGGMLATPGHGSTARRAQGRQRRASNCIDGTALWPDGRAACSPPSAREDDRRQCRARRARPPDPHRLAGRAGHWARSSVARALPRAADEAGSRSPHAAAHRRRGAATPPLAGAPGTSRADAARRCRPTSELERSEVIRTRLDPARVDRAMWSTAIDADGLALRPTTTPIRSRICAVRRDATTTLRTSRLQLQPPAGQHGRCVSCSAGR